MRPPLRNPSAWLHASKALRGNTQESLLYHAWAVGCRREDIAFSIISTAARKAGLRYDGDLPDWAKSPPRVDERRKGPTVPTPFHEIIPGLRPYPDDLRVMDGLGRVVTGMDLNRVAR